MNKDVLDIISAVIGEVQGELGEGRNSFTLNDGKTVVTIDKKDEDDYDDSTEYWESSEWYSSSC